MDQPESIVVRRMPWLLAAVTLLVLGRIVLNDFGPFDDRFTIIENPHLNPPQFTPDKLLWHWTHAHMGLYVPLTYTIWGVVGKVAWIKETPKVPAHFDPGIFHAVSLLFHIAAVLAVYAILRRLTNRPWAAAAGALLFAIHPVQVEAIAWTSGLKDVLSGALSLTAIWLYLRAVDGKDQPSEATGAPPLPPPALYTLAVLSFVLALLAKPSAIMTPLLLLCIDLIILRRSWRSIAKSLSPWFLLAIPIAIIAAIAQSGAGAPSVPIVQRPVVAGASLAFYLWKLLLPTGLAFEYGWRPLVMLKHGWFYAIAFIPIPLVILLFIWRQPWLRAAALLLILPLLPILGLVTFSYQYHSTVADHYLYVAMLGPALAVSWLLTRLKTPPQPTAIVAGIIFAAWAVLSFLQAGDWRDNQTILSRTLAVNPTSPLANNAMGEFYLHRAGSWNRRDFQAMEDFDNAERHFRAAADSNPDFPSPHANLAQMYLHLNRADESIRQIYELLRINAQLPPEDQVESRDIFLNYGMQAPDPRVSVRLFEEEMRYNPRDARAPVWLEKARAAAQRLATKPTR